MSRGRGKIERAIAGAFEAAPNGMFTIRELMELAYPTVSPHEFKHYVATARAARQVAYTAAWPMSERPRGRLCYWRMRFGAAVKGFHGTAALSHREKRVSVSVCSAPGAVVDI